MIFSRRQPIHVFASAMMTAALFAGPSLASSFICAEPGGKRLIEIDGNNIGPVGSHTLTIDDDAIRGRDDKKILLVEDNAVRPGDTPVGVKLLTIDGDNLRHAAGGKVVMNYHHPDICPTSADNRIYSIEGDALTKKQLIAGLYLLKPELFKLSDAETAGQTNAAAAAGADEDKKSAADQVAGKWMVLNSSGIQDKLGKGTISIAEKKGDAYPVTLDFTEGGGPTWTGVGHYAVVNGDKCLWVAYGTPKTTGLCVYDIDGGKLNGKWSPWYIDGDPKNTGTETLSGPATLNGEFKIESAAAPTTGAPYTGTVAVAPTDIVGADGTAKPYLLTWTFGKVKVYGIGVRTGNQLFVAAGAGPDLSIAEFTIRNGAMTGDWFKFGSTEMGTLSATTSDATADAPPAPAPVAAAPDAAAPAADAPAAAPAPAAAAPTADAKAADDTKMSADMTDLSKLSEDFPVTIKAPAGAEVKLDIGDVSVKNGDHFQLHISNAKVDIAARKKDITENTLNKLKKFHVESDDVLVYETDVFGNAEFHFVANIKVGDTVYGCEDEKGPRFAKEDVDAMLEVAKTLAAKK